MHSEIDIYLKSFCTRTAFHSKISILFRHHCAVLYNDLYSTCMCQERERETDTTFSRIMHTCEHPIWKININNIPVYGMFLYFQTNPQGSKAKA